MRGEKSESSRISEGVRMGRKPGWLQLKKEP